MAEARLGRAEMLGVKLGSYRVLSKLGEGGMGVVYVGRHEALGHSVVVKVLQPELSSDGEMVQRFFNEAQAATAIRNLGIVQVFDFGTTPDGRAYFVMELLEGQNLASRLQQRRLTCTEACRFGRQIANVLQVAHARGITHRDLKPENLFLVPDVEAMGGERVKVLDFGIAKLAGQAQVAGVKTRTGLIMGTPCYMSPEQCRGAGVVDARSDIYALGCILFEMSCGRPPFVAEGVGEILGAHQFVEPPHPQSLAPDLLSDLAALIVKMLAKHPDARPQTMVAVSQALDGIMHALGASAPSPSAPAPPAPAPPAPAPPAPAPPALAPPALAPPAPLPSPNSPLALHVPAASTTLRDSAGVSHPRVRTRGRRIVPGLGVLLVISVTALLVFAVANSASGTEPLDGSSSNDKAAFQTTATGEDAAIAVSGSPVPVPVSGSELQEDCIRHQTARRWADLHGCAKRLQAHNSEAAGEFKARAALELEAAPRIVAFESALRMRDLNKAREELNHISPAATDYTKLKQEYGIAEAQAIADVMAQLARSKGNCQTYNQIIMQEKVSRPPRVVDEATRQVKCEPITETACDHEELFQEGKRLFSLGRLTAALEKYEAAWSCKHDPMYADKGFVVACNVPSLKKAKLFWKRMPLFLRQSEVAISVCIRNGITEATLNAP
jgi:serine/threonine-protein kinase